ncbi:hypothetical protein BGW80DRAFT_1556876 [Lactifluus volemus]|nr:hypothetical protein BGW80DRAFT_1556876 [Lactifluus volemus]
MSIRAFTSFASNSQNWLSVVTYPVLFLSLQALSSRTSTNVVLELPSELALVEALKLMSNVYIRHRLGEGLFRQTQSRAVVWDTSREFDQQPLRRLADQESGETVVSAGGNVRQQEPLHGEPTVHSWLTVIYAAVIWVGTTYIFSSALLFFDAATAHVAAATSTALVLYGLYAFSGRPVTALVSQSIALLVRRHSLLYIPDTYSSPRLAPRAPTRQWGLSHPSQSYLTPSLVLLCIAFASASNVLIIDNIYHSHTSSSVYKLNTILFSTGLCLHIANCAFQVIFTSNPPVIFPEWSLHRIAAVIIKACLDCTALSVIRDHDALLERILYSLGLALLLLITSLHNESFSVTILAGLAVSFWVSISYVSKELYKGHHLHDIPESKSSVPSRPRRIIAWTIFVVLGLDIQSLPASQPVCQRRPLHFSPPQSSENRTYTHFDDVLLIVFFSHPRYDTNLDFYREVYTEYFPNMLFVGPANREDAGFDHSYDVLVDTYQAQEDLSDPDLYSMGGRMAHHMLYTAMQEHPCYDGYLWAPFDTLLNVPRLQLFDQRNFGTTHLSAVTFHAPPANISPDPANVVVTPWKGWREDWWSPHVGLPVCIPAFEQVPKSQRDRLAALMGQPDRLIGGSADTMYIPGRHRDTFMSTLALFLKTNASSKSPHPPRCISRCHQMRKSFTLTM